jgi:hypothetical protein
LGLVSSFFGRGKIWLMLFSSAPILSMSSDSWGS